jgi:hypothetical protein
MLLNQREHAQQRARAKNGHLGRKNAILWPDVEAYPEVRTSSKLNLAAVIGPDMLARADHQFSVGHHRLSRCLPSTSQLAR